MIFKFFVSAAISCLITVLIFTIKANIRLQRQMNETEQEIHRVKEQMNTLYNMYIESVRDAAWLRGAHIARPQKGDKQ